MIWNIINSSITYKILLLECRAKRHLKYLSNPNFTFTTPKSKFMPKMPSSKFFLIVDEAMSKPLSIKVSCLPKDSTWKTIKAKTTPIICSTLKILVTTLRKILATRKTMHSNSNIKHLTPMKKLNNSNKKSKNLMKES